MGVLRHQPFEFGLGLFVLGMGGLGAGKNAGEFRPGIRGRHVDHPYRIDPGFRRLQAKQAIGGIVGEQDTTVRAGGNNRGRAARNQHVELLLGIEAGGHFVL